jgi:hypothetical protein
MEGAMGVAVQRLDALTAGANETLRFQVYSDHSRSIYKDLTGLNLVFTARKSPTSTSTLFRKTTAGGGITITDTGSGSGVISVLATDTEDAEAGREYHWDIWIVESKQRIAGGTFRLEAAVTTDFSLPTGEQSFWDSLVGLFDSLTGNMDDWGRA